jgi:REP element-mobilizing transposase RayT
MTNHPPGRPPHLSNVFRKFDPPLYFITFCTFDRKPLLANDAFHNHFIELMHRKSCEGIACGEFVIMPDHIHLFLRIDPRRYELGKTVGFIKQSLSKPLRDAGAAQPHWQPGFFDHILRSADSYSEKWNYVQNNPVRAGLAENANNWPFQGTIVPIRFCSY